MMRKRMILYERIREARVRFFLHVQSVKKGIEELVDTFKEREEKDDMQREEYGVVHEPLFFRRQSSYGLLFGWGAQIILGDDAIAPSPCLVLPDALFRELHYHFSVSVKEFQLMGMVRHDPHNRFVVDEWVFNPHTAGSAHADIDQDTFPLWLDMLEEQGKDLNMLRVQVHSHGILDAYFSFTDVATIRDAYSCDWMISIVGNKVGAMFARLDIYKPIPVSMSLPIVLESPQFGGTQVEEAAWKEKQTMADGTYLLKKGD